ncbi:MAG: AraC family transcriptional regulator [Bacteroidota bacterium]
MLILPRDLLAVAKNNGNSSEPNIQVLLQSEGLSALSKQLSEPIYERTGYLATHAFSFIIQGEQQIETYEGDLLRITAGSGILIPRDLYQISDLVPKGGMFKSLLIYFDSVDVVAKFLGENLNAFGLLEKSKYPNSLPLTFKLEAQEKKLIQKITSSDSTSQTRDQVKALLTLQSKNPKNLFPSLIRFDSFKRRDFKLFMRTHAEKALRVEDFAYLTGRSLSTFRRDFKAAFGQQPRQWLRKRRLDHAYNLLLKGKHRVSDLSQAAGYENVSYFIREFRKQFGQSPKQMMMAQSAMA